jgi:hypothetical protein
MRCRDGFYDFNDLNDFNGLNDFYDLLTTLDHELLALRTI